MTGRRGSWAGTLGALALVLACPAAADAAVLVSKGLEANTVHVATGTDGGNYVQVYTREEAPTGIVSVVALGETTTVAAGPGCRLISAGTVTCTTGPGPITLQGGPRDERLQISGPAIVDGGDGDDIIDINTGTHPVTGGAGNDRIDGSSQADVLRGGDGADEIHGADGADRLEGGPGSDRLWGHASWAGGTDDDADVLLGGPDGDDLDGAGGPDVVDGGDGRDRVTVGDEPAGVRIELAGARATEVGGEGGTIANVEWARGGRGPDVLLGDDGDNHLDGAGGADRIEGRGGADVLDGGRGDDVVEGGPGDDVLVGGEGADVVDGGLGVDELRGDEADDRLNAREPSGPPVRDRTIDCGVRYADTAILDAADVPIDCERREWPDRTEDDAPPPPVTGSWADATRISRNPDGAAALTGSGLTPDGEALALVNDVHAGDDSDSDVVAVAQQRGEAPGTPERLGDSYRSAGARLAVAGDGTALATWRDDALRGNVAAVRPPGGTFSAPAPAGDPRGGYGVPVANARGDIGIVQFVTSERRYVATVRPAGGAWQPPVPVSPPLDEEPSDLQAALAGDGAVLALWRPRWNGQLRAAVREADGTVRPVQTLSETPGAYLVAADADGGTTVAWQETSVRDGAETTVTKVASRAPGAPFGDAVDAVPSTGPGHRLLGALTMARDGTVTVGVVEWRPGTTCRVHLVSGPGAEALASIGVLDACSSVQLAVSPGGTLLASWLPDGIHQVTSVRGPDGAWGAVQDVRPRCERVTAAAFGVEDDGRAVAWLSDPDGVHVARHEPFTGTGHQYCLPAAAYRVHPPPADEPPAEEPPVLEPPAEEPPVVEPPVAEPPAEAPAGPAQAADEVPPPPVVPTPTPLPATPLPATPLPATPVPATPVPGPVPGIEPAPAARPRPPVATRPAVLGARRQGTLATVRLRPATAGRVVVTVTLVDARRRVRARGHAVGAGASSVVRVRLRRTAPGPLTGRLRVAVRPA